MLGVLVVGPVRRLVGEVRHDREAPRTISQAEVVAEGVADRARAVQAPEAVLDLGHLGGVGGGLELDENDIPDHETSL